MPHEHDLRPVDVAGILDCSVKTVYSLARSGKLRGYKLGARAWRFKRMDVEAVRRPVHIEAETPAPKVRVPARRGGHLPGWHDFDHSGKPS